MAKRRRGRGEGGVEQLPSGSWRAVTPSRIDPATGKRVRDSKTFPTKPESLAWLAAQVSAPKPAASGTVGEWLTEWLSRHRATTGASNYDVDQRFVCRYIRPHLADIRLRDLDRRTIADWLAKLDTTPGNKHVAARTLRKALNAAVEAGRLASSPMARMRLPRRIRAEVRPMTAQNLAAFVACAESVKLGPLVRVWADTGCRPSELLALRWEDYDATAGRLHIRRNICRRTSRIKEPKSRAGRRVLLLSAPTRAALDGFRPAGAVAGPMFATRSGGHWIYTHFLKRRWKPLKAKLPAELQWITPYTLRHTCASLLLSAGVNVRVIADRLGHSDPAMTLRVYSHLMPGDQERAAEVMGGVLPTALPTTPEIC